MQTHELLETIKALDELAKLKLGKRGYAGLSIKGNGKPMLMAFTTPSKAGDKMAHAEVQDGMFRIAIDNVVAQLAALPDHEPETWLAVAYTTGNERIEAWGSTKEKAQANLSLGGTFASLSFFQAAS